MKVSASALTQLIKTQRGSLAVELNGPSNRDQDSKTQWAGALLLLLTVLLWLSCSPHCQDSLKARPGGWAQGSHCS